MFAPARPVYSQRLLAAFIGWAGRRVSFHLSLDFEFSTKEEGLGAGSWSFMSWSRSFVYMLESGITFRHCLKIELDTLLSLLWSTYFNHKLDVFLLNGT